MLKAKMRGNTVSIGSCGLDVRVRMKPPPDAGSAALKFGVDVRDHLSQSWETCSPETADLILAMEYWQYRELLEMFPGKRGNIKLLSEFAPFPHCLLPNIRDPFGRGESCFVDCFSLISRAVDNLSTVLERGLQKARNTFATNAFKHGGPFGGG
jgi:protein-tyrosine phosphatase